MLRIYGDSISGNCLKVKWTADHLALPYEWIEVDVLQRQSRTPAFLAMNPAGQVPVVILDDGRPLSQSNAIILHLADGSDLIPADRYDRGKMLEWMFWEQYTHEPAIAVARFQVRYLGRAVSDLDPTLVAKGLSALQRLENGLAETPFLVGHGPTLADVALVAYTRAADEGGFDLAQFPKVQDWIGRVERALNISPRS
jgi:glutathione S-transferase